MAKISAVVPVYKAEDFIGELINSLQKQTIRDLEIILVDDGSPDNSGKICDEYAAKDDRIRVIHKANGGVGAARNDGLDAAVGEWVYFCDSDDWVEADALEKLVTAGEKERADVVYGNVNLISYGNVKTLRFHKDAFATNDRNVIDQLIATDFSRMYCYYPPESGPASCCYGGPWNKIVRRQMLLDKDIRFDLRVKGIYDDILYTAHIFAAANKVAYINVPVYNYRLLDSSITHTYKANLLEINDAIFHSWQEFMAKYGKDGQFEKPFYANVIRRFKSTLGLYFFSEKNTKTFGEQCAEMKALLNREPYCTAIREVDPDKLHNSYDKLIWKAARRKSPRQIYFVYQLSVLIKKLKC